MDNIYLIDKPAGWTSFDVVAKIRGLLSQKEGKRIKVGHAGTLDPFATGLLIVLVGSKTKRQDEFMKLDKEYEATLKLGFTSTTGDPEGTITPSLRGIKDDEAILEQDRHAQLAMTEIEEVLKKFVGKIKQTPPSFSAIKINGERAYKLARTGKDIKIKPRTILIYSSEVLDYKYPLLKLKIKCSTGTYIRTLAEDIGKKLGTGAYLTKLCRIKIGDYNVYDAMTIEELKKKL